MFYGFFNTKWCRGIWNLIKINRSVASVLIRFRLPIKNNINNFTMNDDKIDKTALEIRKQLQEKRREILELPPREALDSILQDPRQLPLVHSFPEQDLYLLIHDIGPEDAQPLLALASEKQWDHIVDLEAWQKDRIDLQSATRWLDLLLEADQPRFIRWFLEQKLEFI